MTARTTTTTTAHISACPSSEPAAPGELVLGAVSALRAPIPAPGAMASRVSRGANIPTHGSRGLTHCGPEPFGRAARPGPREQAFRASPALVGCASLEPPPYPALIAQGAWGSSRKPRGWRPAAMHPRSAPDSIGACPRLSPHRFNGPTDVCSSGFLARDSYLDALAWQSKDSFAGGPGGFNGGRHRPNVTGPVSVLAN